MTLDYKWIILVHEYVFMDMVIVFHVSKRKKINGKLNNYRLLRKILHSGVSRICTEGNVNSCLKYNRNGCNKR